MNPHHLQHLQEELFTKDLLSRLDPQNIILRDDGLLHFACDYYGALLGIEEFLAAEKDYRLAFGNPSFLQGQNRVIWSLLHNLQVPNYQTNHPFRRLNDRIFSALQSTQSIPSSALLEDLVEQLDRSKRGNTEEYQFKLRLVGDYSKLALLLAHVFASVVVAPNTALELITDHRVALSAVKENSVSDYEVSSRKLRQALDETSLTYKPINGHLGSSYSFQDNIYHCSPAFSREWKKMEQQADILSGHASRKTFSFSLGRLRNFLPHFGGKSRLAAYILGASLLAGSTALYFAPGLRYDLSEKTGISLLASSRERVETLIERKEFTEAKRVLYNHDFDPSDRFCLGSYISLSEFITKLHQSSGSLEDLFNLFNANYRLVSNIDSCDWSDSHKSDIFNDLGFLSRNGIFFQSDYPPAKASYEILSRLGSSPDEILSEGERSLKSAVTNGADFFLMKKLRRLNQSTDPTEGVFLISVDHKSGPTPSLRSYHVFYDRGDDGKYKLIQLE
jgi:hypothetical protein